jgi:SAM-dependent methyltransferase
VTDLQNFVLRLIGEVDSLDVAEFGNKKNKTGIYRDWYLAHGAKSYISIDINGEDGALELDVQERLELGEFDLVTNFGFSEHVEQQAPFWHNAITMTRKGGRLVNSTPAPRKRLNHGNCHWHPSDRFYERLAKLNGFEVIDRWEQEGLLNYALLKVRNVGETIVPVHLLWRNPRSHLELVHAAKG